MSLGLYTLVCISEKSPNGHNSMLDKITAVTLSLLSRRDVVELSEWVELFLMKSPDVH